ncbi:hypothetical protein HanRHA438_Chr09g0396741 [Helianthus annuus]|nr:hypothetical protein HanRHA438_Chr09g0396741 [Helianthus annuus]
MVSSRVFSYNLYQQCVCARVLGCSHGSAWLGRWSGGFNLSYCNITLCKCPYCRAPLVWWDEAYRIQMCRIHIWPESFILLHGCCNT